MGRVVCAVLAIALCSGALPAAATERVQDVAVPGSDGPITVKLFEGGQGGKRPAVIILHGRQSVAQLSTPYTRWAEQIAAKGFDAYLVSYYSAADSDAMASSDHTARTAYFKTRIAAWADRVREVVSYALKRNESSGKIGLLGFSNGGFLAVQSAAADPRIAALVVFYGGLPERLEIAHLAPLLALHGDADRVIPLSSGQALVDKAHTLGGTAELVVYPGAGHGFVFYPERSDARDATARALSFLERQLKD